MLDVVAIGEVLIDFTPGNKVEGENEAFICNPGGAPANVAAMLARLGIETALVSKVGEDHFGSLLREVLLRCGVDVSALTTTDEANTTLAFVHLDDEGDRSFSFYRKPGADTYLHADEVPFDTIEASRLLHFGSVSMTHEPSRTATREAVLKAKASGVLISFDPNIRLALWQSSEEAKQNILWGMQYADVLKISEEELVFMTGKTDVKQGALELQQQFDITWIVVTMGAKGCYYRIAELDGYVSGFPVEVVDTTGAGDAFLGCLLYKVLTIEHDLHHLEAKQLHSMLTFANAGAALVTTRKGALQSMPTVEEINKMIEGSEATETIDRYGEPFRPGFHFSPPSHWLNDPNGLVYYEGVYHLFYQHHPHGNKWGPMHWGHAVSEDLIHWQHEPIALYPDEHGAIFSGSCVVDWNNSSGLFDEGLHGLVAIFTHADTCPATDQPRQRQSLAYSADKGKTWNKYEGNPVLVEEELIDFRDPKVFWHQPSQKWVMVIVAGDHVRFYNSPNLREWTFTGKFGDGQGSHDGVWECPDLFQLPIDGSDENKWVLIISIGDHPEYPEGSRTQYFIGEFDGNNFINDNEADHIVWLDYGRDNYAGVTWSDIPAEDGRRIMIGWMSNWKYANETPTGAWRGAMTLPRTLSLTRDDEQLVLTQLPVQEVEKLRQSTLSWNKVEVTPQNSFTCKTESELLEIEAVIDFKSGSEVAISLQATDNSDIIVGYDPKQQRLYIDRSQSGIIDFHSAFPCKHGAHLAVENGLLKLRIWLDRNSIEVYANEGKVAITDQIFSLEPVDTLKIASTADGVIVQSLHVHSLHSIHETTED